VTDVGEAAADETILVEREGELARVTMHRPMVHNALDASMVARLSGVLGELDADGGVRVVVLGGAGKSFSAGADLAWMKRMGTMSEAENRQDADGLAQLLHRLDSLTKPTIALINGAALGGAVGLIAACDIAVASETASFGLSEARLGLIPSVISPYVVRAIGERVARRYMLTAERFHAHEALRIGLIHELVAPEGLVARGRALAELLFAAGPVAQREIKDLLRLIFGRPVEAGLRAETAARIARIRASAEAREGIAAFLEKRRPDWAR
jgi:methylglutaconyl-CoA hydratase